MFCQHRCNCIVLGEPTDAGGGFAGNVRLRDKHWRKRPRKARRDSRKFGEGRDYGGIGCGVESRLAATAVLEMEDRAVVFYLDDVACIVHSLVGAAVNVGSGDEKIQLLQGGRRFASCGSRIHQSERALELALVVPLAVEYRPNRFRTMRGRPHETADVGGVAPKISATCEVLAVAQRVGKQNPIDTAGRRTAHDVEDDFGIREFLDQPVNAVTLDCVVELLRNAIDIDREGNASIHDETDSRLSGSGGYFCRAQ